MLYPRATNLGWFNLRIAAQRARRSICAENYVVWKDKT
jgi:hypothetical protein